ncbi:MAG: hypothetical protein ACOVP7_09840, partial [Lacibacter sp.]
MLQALLGTLDVHQRLQSQVQGVEMMIKQRGYQEELQYSMEEERILQHCQSYFQETFQLLV